MSVFISKDNSELITTCSCGCKESIHISIKNDDDSYAFMSYMNGNFYKDQGGTFFRKLKKIFAILFNKDYYYSEIIMTKEEYDSFKQYVNRF